MTLLFTESLQRTVSMLIQNWSQILGRAVEWMWSGFCGGGSLCQRYCRRTESCSVIHIHSYSRGTAEYREFNCFLIVSEWVPGVRAGQSPGLIIKSKYTLKTSTLPADALIRHWYSHTSHPTPLHLPVTASTHTLSTQHLRKIMKSVRMNRILLVSPNKCSHSVAFRQTEIFMCSVRIQVSWWESENKCAPF